MAMSPSSSGGRFIGLTLKCWGLARWDGAAWQFVAGSGVNAAAGANAFECAFTFTAALADTYYVFDASSPQAASCMKTGGGTAGITVRLMTYAGAAQNANVGDALYVAVYR